MSVEITRLDDDRFAITVIDDDGKTATAVLPRAEARRLADALESHAAAHPE